MTALLEVGRALIIVFGLGATVFLLTVPFGWWLARGEKPPSGEPRHGPECACFRCFERCVGKRR